MPFLGIKLILFFRYQAGGGSRRCRFSIASRGLGDRDPEAELAAHDTIGIVEVSRLQPAVMGLHDRAAQLEPDSHAFGLGAVEGLVDALEHFGRHALAGILHAEFDHGLLLDLALAHAQFDMAHDRRPLRLLDRFSAVLYQVDQHLLDQDRVDHQRRHSGGQIAVEPDLVPPQFDLGQLGRVAHHLRDIGQRHIGFAALDEGADALNDLAGPLRLLDGLLERAEQFFLVDLLALEARDDAAAVVVDRGQRLVELM